MSSYIWFYQKCGTNHNEEHYLVGIAGIRDEHKLETQNYQPIEIQVKPLMFLMECHITDDPHRESGCELTPESFCFRNQVDQVGCLKGILGLSQVNHLI